MSRARRCIIADGADGIWRPCRLRRSQATALPAGLRAGCDRGLRFDAALGRRSARGGISASRLTPQPNQIAGVRCGHDPKARHGGSADNSRVAVIERGAVRSRDHRRHAVERQRQSDVVVAKIAGGRLRDPQQAVLAAAASRHHIEVGDLARGQPRGRRRVAWKMHRVGSAGQCQRRGVADRQHQAASPDDGEGAVDAGERGKRSVRRHQRQADAPVEVFQRGAGRSDGDLGGRASAVLPRRRLARVGANDPHGRLQARPGRSRWCCRAQSIAMS